MYSSLALNTELAYISNKSKQWDLQIAIHLEYAALNLERYDSKVC